MDTSKLTANQGHKFLENFPEPPEGFEWTGEYRVPKCGEWLTDCKDRPSQCESDSMVIQCLILRKIEPDPPECPFEVGDMITNGDYLRSVQPDGLYCMDGTPGGDDPPDYPEGWHVAKEDEKRSYHRAFPRSVVKGLDLLAKLLFKDQSQAAFARIRDNLQHAIFHLGGGVLSEEAQHGLRNVRAALAAAKDSTPSPDTSSLSRSDAEED